MKNILILLCIFAVFPHVVFAGPIIRSGDAVSVDATQKLEGDFYGVGTTVTLSGTADEDVYVAGGQVTINGPIAKDLSILGGAVGVHAPVEDDLRVIGLDVVLASPVKGDVMVIGGTLTVLSTATIGGDILFFGKNLVVEGVVEGTIHGSSERIRVDATVEGDIEYTATYAFVLGDKANIAGDVTYTSFNEIVRGQGTVVEGDVRHIPSPVGEANSFFQMYLLFFAVILFSVLSFYFVARNVVERLVRKTASHNFGLYGLIGLGTLITVLVGSSVLLLSFVGSIVGIFLILSLTALLVGAYILGVCVLGYVLQKFALNMDACTLYTPILGAVTFTILSLVPHVGIFAVLAITIVSFGAVVHGLYHMVRG